MIGAASLALDGCIIRNGAPVEEEREGGGIVVSTAHNCLYRVFNRDWNHGGRFYGGWWQNIVSKNRAKITIGGDATVEHDFPRLHPTLLYAEAGKPMHGDPYDLPDWPRKQVKRAFNILVNAETRQSAICAIAQEIGGKGAFLKADALAAELERKHKPIAHMFGSGAGLRLQRRDSDMAEAVLLNLAAKGMPCLPVHDSFIVANQHGETVMEMMRSELEKACKDNLAPSTAYPKAVPQYGGRFLVSGLLPPPSSGPPLAGDPFGATWHGATRPRFALDPGGARPYVGTSARQYELAA
jgi:hypothetical protein